jgi:hypothetical protein
MTLVPPQVWNVYEGYNPVINLTQMLHVVPDFDKSYNELIKNKDNFKLHSYNEIYVKSGPLRECKSAHLINDQKNNLIVDLDTYVETFILLDRLKKIINKDGIVSRAYVTILSPGKKIYPHCDTHGGYWSNINRYQFYYTGNNDIHQIICNTLFPVAPGYLYHFDHRQIHEYHNNSSEDLILMVFDILKTTT